jgi:hypothetical protein
VPAPGPAAARYDADDTRAKVAAARAAGTEQVDIPPVPPGMEEHAAAVLAERQRQFMTAYTDVALPEPDQAALRAMLARPGGATTRTAAQALPHGRTKIHQQLVRWRQEGTAVLRGRGAGASWHSAEPDRAYPPLRVIGQHRGRPAMTAAAIVRGQAMSATARTVSCLLSKTASREQRTVRLARPLPGDDHHER